MKKMEKEQWDVMEQMENNVQMDQQGPEDTMGCNGTKDTKGSNGP